MALGRHPDRGAAPPSRLNLALLALAVLTGALYFAYRLPLWNPHAPVLSTLLVGAEAYGVLTLALHVFMTWRVTERTPPPPAGDIRADILVTTWNEPVELLRHTLLAAKAVRRVGEVWLLDDGDRPAMRALAEGLGVRYLSRAVRTDAKAGNLNNALAHGRAAFLAVFDSDHAPAADFLERTLGYFRDPELAFVQTPQDFYNLDSLEHRAARPGEAAWQEQSLFYQVIQPGKDVWNAAFFCGSCAVLRRAALDDVGGFATGTITEDFHTSVRMHMRGWRSVFHAEPLAFGLSAFTLEDYELQRLRWGRGAMQVWRRERALLGGRLSPAQWACYFASSLAYFEGWQKAILYFTPAYALLTGTLPIVWSGPEFLAFFLPWLLAGVALNEALGRGRAKTLWREEYSLLRYFVFMRATLALLVPRAFAFQVTSKGAAAGPHALTRLAPQILVAVAGGAAIVAGSLAQIRTERLPWGAFWANLVWAAFVALVALRAVAFALRRDRRRRSDYRFHLPVPVRLDAPVAGTRLLAAGDLSATGLRLTLPEPPGSAAIRGQLLLPEGPKSFAARAVRTQARSDGRLDVGFELRLGPEGADALSRALYGNDLQIEIGDGAGGPSQGSGKGGWRAALLVGGSARPIRCLARPLDGRREVWRVLAYERPSREQGLSLATPERRRGFGRMELVACRTRVLGPAAVHIMRLAAAEPLRAGDPPVRAPARLPAERAAA